MTSQPSSRPVEEVLDEQRSTADGLSRAEAERRRDEYGPNEIARGGGRTPLGIFLAQFDSVLIWVLLVAAPPPAGPCDHRR